MTKLQELANQVLGEGTHSLSVLQTYAALMQADTLSCGAEK